MQVSELHIPMEIVKFCRLKNVISQVEQIVYEDGV